MRGSGKRNACNGRIKDFRSLGPRKTLREIFEILNNFEFSPEFTAIRVPYGGNIFKKHTISDKETIESLQKLASEAPIHIPPTIELAIELALAAEKMPIVFIFETAFFCSLPEREAFYAVPRKISESLKLRRYGYHGIFHQAAVEEGKKNKAERVISICLDALPEIVAAIKGKPVFTTSGCTPLEGLPGRTTCGEIDPFIVTMLNKKLGLGPEEINRILSEESGLRGITGKNKIDFPEIYLSNSPECILAKEIFEYRILKACGSCVAAMGGVDMIVFSGKHHSLSEKIKEFISKHLKIKESSEIEFVTCADPLAKIMAEFAETCIIANKLKTAK